MAWRQVQPAVGVSRRRRIHRRPSWGQDTLNILDVSEADVKGCAFLPPSTSTSRAHGITLDDVWRCRVRVLSVVGRRSLRACQLHTRKIVRTSFAWSVPSGA